MGKNLALLGYTLWGKYDSDVFFRTFHHCRHRRYFRLPNCTHSGVIEETVPRRLLDLDAEHLSIPAHRKNDLGL